MLGEYTTITLVYVRTLGWGTTEIYRASTFIVHHVLAQQSSC